METFPALLAFCAGNSPVTGELVAQRPEARGFDVFFDLRLKQQFSKQWRRRWFETPSCSLCSHYNEFPLSVIGCPNPTPAGGSTIERHRNMATVFCPDSHTSWDIYCQDNEWVGSWDNCTAGKMRCESWWRHLNVTGPLWGESTGYLWIPYHKGVSNTEVWYLSRCQR